MTGEPLITVNGNLGTDPELRFTPAGVPVANFSVACTPRQKQEDEWTDGETMWFRCAAWRGMAENVAESLTSGMPVVVQGYLTIRKYEDRDKQQRVSMELNVVSVGPDLARSTAKVTPTRHQGGGGQQRQQSQGAQNRPQERRQAADDPWATPAPQGGGQSGSWTPGPGASGEQPPF
jgi:single-strand DNA-binding protein